MKFMNDAQRKAAFKNMNMPKSPSIKQMSTNSGLDGLNKSLFGFDNKTSALVKKMEVNGTFDHLKNSYRKE